MIAEIRHVKIYRLLLFEKVVGYCLLADAVNGHYVNVLSTHESVNYAASLRTEYMDTTDTCLELYYQATGYTQHTILRVSVMTEDMKIHELASTGEKQSDWVRMFVKLPDGFHRIIIDGTHNSDISVDDVVVQACGRFG